MRSVILAAGYATRLYPLTVDKPKCLLTVGGRTILDSIADKIAGVPGMKDLTIVTNSRFYAQLSDWARSNSRRLPIRVLDDGTTSNDNRLGAIGDLGFAVRQAGITEDLLVLASDNLFEQGLADFCAAGARHGGACVGVYDIRDRSLAAGKYGVLETDAQGIVLSMEEKPQEPRSSLIGMGVYYYSGRILPMISDYLSEKNAQDAPGHFVRWLLGREKIRAFTFGGMWYDIGDLKALEEANRCYQHRV
ncbi:MAG: Glucose-1-phosphate thymidylyltransferase 1 [Candidatus Omnitrophica bacterium]|nr:Glucose-1-phosphate thymidylyltransferase 1 [Candidatus Omnitrophota bacterium]